jgi:hypothetical protein
MTSPVYEEKKQSSLHYKLEEHPVPQAWRKTLTD